MSTVADFPVVTKPRRKRWTRRQYVKLFRLDMLGDRRVELIGGEIVVMSPQFDLHAAGVSLSQEALQTAFGPGFWARPQSTLNLGPGCMPDPDVSVVSGSPRQATRSYSKTALLVVEVSDSTLLLDRGRKGSMYARFGILDYWIINLVDRQVEVYREPRPDRHEPFGFGYSQKATYVGGQVIAPLGKPDSLVRVGDLLP